MMNLGFQGAAGWFGWRIEYVSLNIVFPTVINAGEAAFFIAAEEEGSAAM
jgi:hypothetical protein